MRRIETRPPIYRELNARPRRLVEYFYAESLINPMSYETFPYWGPSRERHTRYAHQVAFSEWHFVLEVLDSEAGERVEAGYWVTWLAWVWSEREKIDSGEAKHLYDEIAHP